MLKIRKIGYIADNRVYSEDNDFVVYLGSRSQDGLKVELKTAIGSGISRREIMISDVAFDAGWMGSSDPVIAGDVETLKKRKSYCIYRDKIFELLRDFQEPHAIEKAPLRIRKTVLEEEHEIAGLRRAVANLELAKTYSSGPSRTPIPDDVRVAVWARDRGICVKCGSSDNLHFDHIIPVAKGGSPFVENIQILCQQCNLRKSDRIA